MTAPGRTDWAKGHDLIVLEGCDGAGKTTLAAALAARCGYVIVHATLTPEGTDLFEKYRAILARPGPLVLDRSFVSELVYGPLERGYSRLSLSRHNTSPPSRHSAGASLSTSPATRNRSPPACWSATATRRQCHASANSRLPTQAWSPGSPLTYLSSPSTPPRQQLDHHSGTWWAMGNQPHP